ncbi:23S rRNA (guanosine(2251)-2'-O)-methyltransferase RlmB [Sporanaerobium hydrogeniformans]|uniref:23S rRNA (Guanosine(2251)-2'-O)-methyltransferase RlmB n=1 Tax=Sporanaerobium hydrogeniformans TaxID=3072179 RepID=A0AC61DG94_9FIRM|nr:RNA methyltransferase [Sporanaerobium hydrogeniformans]PHV71617.1 23S rRNA (guanosine(2251)-2'-O)-methyltransferase RlmB [Sporanaerobium hydrogeniformans]
MMPKEIASLQNPVLKMINQLQKKKAVRKKEGLFVVEGLRAVREITKEFEVEYYVTTKEVEVKDLPGLEKSKWIVVPTALYKAISETEAPQGVMAVVKMPNCKLQDLVLKERGFYLILENLQDPGNMGTIIRTAHAFGANGILITKGSVDVFSPKVVRSTMGSLFHVPLVVDCEIEEYREVLRQAEIPIYATALEEAKPIYHINFVNPLAIVIGNEGNGVSDYIKKAADYKMMIPMPGGSESLNASVATSICIYEVMRQLEVNAQSCIPKE